jgi:hypothetical protein
MLSTLAVVVFLLLLAWLLRASKRWPSSNNDDGWDAGYQAPLGSGESCSADAREDFCDSATDSDSGGDCGSDGGGSD